MWQDLVALIRFRLLNERARWMKKRQAAKTRVQEPWVQQTGP